MNIVTLLKTSTNESGDAVDFSRDITRNKSGIVQVRGVDDACNTLVEGRLTADADWVEIVSFTGNGAKACLTFPEVRATTTDNTSTDVLIQMGA